ncbi:hypothetical protein ACFY78_02270 [Streptomyces olindensis]|uniref:hypothetical protein n=1 Tax=Streptomyces olindensis TaxID=358823 RepID=UPI003681C652
MADEQYRWLDRETAERLLSGEPPEAVDGAHRGEAERLARTLGALSGPPPLTSEELPGEAAAMAAFRKARAERADAGAAPAAGGGQASGEVADTGLVRIGAPGDPGSGEVRRPSWARPARLALAAVLAVGMVGGVAVAAGTGVLRTPFGGEEPHPGASVSTGVTPYERPLVSPSPSEPPQGGATPDDGTRDGTSAGGSGGSGGSGRGEARDDADSKPDSGDKKGGSGDSRRDLAAACRDLRDGKRLDADRRRALRDAAGGTRVWRYCERVLSEADPRSGERNDRRQDKGGHKFRDGGPGQEPGQGGKPGREQGEKQGGTPDRPGHQHGDRPGHQHGERAGQQDGGADDRDRGRSARALAPLRPAISSALKISSARV